jgi:hypothetical protein
MEEMRAKFVAMVCGVLIAVWTAVGAMAQQTEIERTISSQIEAFKSDDFEQAFAYATPRLQRLFQSPANFERMVTRGYPMIWRPAEVRYLDMRESEGAFWQKVQITDAKGFTHLVLYRMQDTEFGWRIAGVQLLQVPGGTA